MMQGRASPLRLKLLVLSGAQVGQSHPLAPGSHVLGKTPECDIVLSDKTVSRLEESYMLVRLLRSPYPCTGSDQSEVGAHRF